MKCFCDKWEKGIEAVNGPITLQSLRTNLSYQYPKEYEFKFCPWCGKELEMKEFSDEDLKSFSP